MEKVTNSAHKNIMHKEQYRVIFLINGIKNWITIEAKDFNDCYQQVIKRFPDNQIHTISPLDFFNCSGR